MRSRAHIPKGKSKPWVPRLVADISPELFFKLQVIPHGLKRKVYIAMAEEVVRLMDQGGVMALAAIVDKKIGLGYNHLESGDYEPRRPEEVDKRNDGGGAARPNHGDTGAASAPPDTSGGEEREWEGKDWWEEE